MGIVNRWVAAALVAGVSEACTSILIGPGATADGTVWVGQSDDGEGAGDARMVWVPAMDWPAGSERPVFDYEDFPRYVGRERRVEAYYPSASLPNETENRIGSIPQVNHTFGYYEGDYAISNEHGVAFGESTVSAKIFTKPVSAGGKALLSMYELSRLAAERCATATCAVETMGALAERHGFWGSPERDTGGESLLVADKDAQWIFHVLAADEAEGGAIWCAEKIPRDHAAVVANAFVIGYVDEASDAFKYSETMHAIAKARGFWDGDGKLHFTRAFSAGEYTSHAYSGRRMWAFWSVVAPSLGVPDDYEVYVDAVGAVLPVHARTDAALVDRDAVLSKVYRNYYQGTKYDLSAGKAAGPFGTPVRYKPGPGEKAVAGACGSDGAPCESWERSIASFRSVNIHLTNLGDHVAPVSWFLPASSLGGVFVPVPVRDAKVPEALSDALNTKVDRTKAFWVFRELAQFAYPRWNLVKDKIAALQKDLEANGARALDANDHAAAVVQAWRGLHDDLLVQFSDGWNYDGVSANVVGYPADWLERVDFGSASETTHASKTTCP